jgi:hypothetical protein
MKRPTGCRAASTTPDVRFLGPGAPAHAFAKAVRESLEAEEEDR